MKRSTKKGFTIVELVIVIAVIAILAAVLIPTFSGVIQQANESAAQQGAANIYQLYLAEKADEQTFVDTLVIEVGSGSDAKYIAYKNGVMVKTVYASPDAAAKMALGVPINSTYTLVTATGETVNTEIAVVNDDITVGVVTTRAATTAAIGTLTPEPVETTAPETTYPPATTVRVTEEPVSLTTATVVTEGVTEAPAPLTTAPVVTEGVTEAPAPVPTTAAVSESNDPTN